MSVTTSSSLAGSGAVADTISCSSRCVLIVFTHGTLLLDISYKFELVEIEALDLRLHIHSSVLPLQLTPPHLLETTSLADVRLAQEVCHQVGSREERARFSQPFDKR